MGPNGVNSSVRPSGSAFTTARTPMRPSAPTRLSTMTVSFSSLRNSSASMRMSPSPALPAAKG